MCGEWNMCAMTVRAVIFDLDGTLYNKSGLAWRLALSQGLRGNLRLLKREREVRKRLKGVDFGDEARFREAFFGAFGNPRAQEWYDGQYMPDMVRILRGHYRIAPWVEPRVRQLRADGVKVAVFSDYGCVAGKLEAIGFDPAWADLIADAPSLGGLKPSKASFERLCGRLQVSPGECLMVGDRDDTDGEGARAAGMLFELLKS